MDKAGGKTADQTGSSGPEFYEIWIEGHLESSWSSWLHGMDIRHEENGETILSGALPDQTALHGVLIKLRDLGLPLVAVKKVIGKEKGGRL